MLPTSRLRRPVIEPNPPIYFIRHGETDWNREQRIQGQIDIVLSETGHLQSEAVARVLANFITEPEQFAFYVSPLTRARQTMSYLARTFELSENQIQVEDSLRELGYGVWEGRYFQELKSDPAYPHNLIQRFAWRPEGGESYADGMDRLRQWVGRLDRPTVIVSHGAIGRCLIALACDLTPERTLTQPTPQGYFSRITNGRIEWFDATSGTP